MEKLLTLITILLLLIPSFVFSNEPLVSMTQQECKEVLRNWKKCPPNYLQDSCRNLYEPEMLLCYGHIPTPEPVNVNNRCFISTLKEK